MEQIKPEKLNAIATIKESFSLTLKNIKPIITAQWLYFVLAAALTLPIMAIMGGFMIEHSSALIEASKNKIPLPPELIAAMYGVGGKLMVIVTLGYVLHKMFMNNLYEWMKSGNALGSFQIWPISSNAWRLMWLDVKVFFACFMPLMVVIIIAVIGGVLYVMVSAKDPGTITANAVLLGAASIPVILIAALWLLYRTQVLIAAQPSIYEDKPIPLMKVFWKATKGNRWKITISNLIVLLPALIVNRVLEGLFKNAFLTGQHAMAYVGEAAMLAAAFFVAIWLAFNNVLIWKHIRKNVPELNGPAA